MAFSTFLDMIAAAAEEVPFCGDNKCGAGVWAIEDEDHEPTGELLLIQRGECHSVNGSKLTRVDVPIFQNITADLGTKVEWYDPEVLADLLPRATQAEFREKAYRDLHEIISSWRWEHQDQDIVTCGLILCSWMQSVWQWRPIVALTGESNSGKTYLLEFLEELFLGLANLSGNSTAAGVRIVGT